MFELWVLWEDGMVLAFASDSLEAVRAIEYEQATYGYVTEIRLKG